MSTKESFFRLPDRDAVFYYAISRAFYLLGLIPQKTAARLSRIMGRIWFVSDRRHRQVALSNLSRVYGDRLGAGQIRSMARNVFCNLVMLVFEIGWSLHIKDSDIKKHFRFRGMGNLQRALQEKKGVLILTAHIGNWELLIDAAGRIGMPISAIYRPLEFGPLDRFFIDLRRRSGATLFSKKSAMLGVMRSLKKNALIGVLLDQNSRRKHGVFADFFGTPASTSKGLALLARKTGAPVVPLFLVRDSGYFLAEFGKPLPKIMTGDKNKDIKAATLIYNKVIEDIIMRYPEQWFWVHRRWKKKPIRVNDNEIKDS
jgi:KDO2-lipid IV(A) lauroyltransferase